jgi:hypothetical protein
MIQKQGPNVILSDPVPEAVDMTVVSTAISLTTEKSQVACSNQVIQYDKVLQLRRTCTHGRNPLPDPLVSVCHLPIFLDITRPFGGGE